MTGSTPKPSADGAPSPLPAMPQSLQRVLLRTFEADAVSSTQRAAECEGTAATTSSSTGAHGTESVVPTDVLLQRVDELYFAFRRVVEQCARASSLNRIADTAADEVPADNGGSDALAQLLAAFEEKTASVQSGIRSKLQQTARFAIIAHLQSEIAARQHAVTRMSAALEVARKALPPTTQTPSLPNGNRV